MPSRLKKAASILQRTIAAPVAISGRGLHTGIDSEVRIVPAPAGHGIQFRRIDLPGSRPIPARAQQVVSTERGTHLGLGKASVMTVEHLMAAFSGLGIDHAMVEVRGREMPGLDGSALTWVRLLKKAGTCQTGPGLGPVVLRKPVAVTLGQSQILALPAEGLRITTLIDFDRAGLGQQFISLEITPRSFVSGVAGARTFCLESEIKQLQKMGLGLGGSLDSVVVVGNQGPLNGTMRFPDECVRHKMLDLVGDLALLGRPLRAHVIAVKAGHASHVALVKRLERTLI